MTFYGPYLAGCALLVVAGAAKAAQPADTARALGRLVGAQAIGPLAAVVRAGAVAELALGAAALALPRPALAGAVALSYAAFAGYVLVLRLRGGPLATCGCFGTPDTPPTVLHVVYDAGLALAALAVALSTQTGSIADALAGQPLAGVPLLAASALCAWLVVLALSPLATLAAVRRLVAHAAERS